jgi:hypothetical protein
LGSSTLQAGGDYEADLSTLPLRLRLPFSHQWPLLSAGTGIALSAQTDKVVLVQAEKPGAGF